MEKRVFVSLALPEHIKEYFKSLQVPEVRWIKWMKPGNFHITLNFLGEITDRDIAEAKKILSETASNFKPIHIKFSEVQGERDMLWVLPKNAEKIELLHDELKTKLKEMHIGKRERRSFTPHILLGKSKTGRRMTWQPENFQETDFAADHINLYQSELTPGSATHTLLESYPLTGNEA